MTYWKNLKVTPGDERVTGMQDYIIANERDGLATGR